MLDFITWTADPVLINLGFIQIRWYGLMFAIGFLVGYKIEEKIYRREGVPEEWLSVLLLWTVAGTVIGARLGHVFFYEWDIYKLDPIKILYIWEGGLASHGGTIGVMAGIFLYSWLTTHRSPLWAFDRLVIPVALVGALIRIGNLFNSEIFGHATELPWGFMFVRSREWHQLYEGQACHPTQIYEALCYIGLFFLLHWMYWKKNAGERRGLLFGTFFVILFGARFLIEFIKNPQVEFENDMILNMGQCLSMPFIIIGILLIIWSLTHNPVKTAYPNKFPEPQKK